MNQIDRNNKLSLFCTHEILDKAVTDDASDIHFEYSPNFNRLRFRINGILVDYTDWLRDQMFSRDIDQDNEKSFFELIGIHIIDMMDTMGLISVYSSVSSHGRIRLNLKPEEYPDFSVSVSKTIMGHIWSLLNCQQ